MTPLDQKKSSKDCEGSGKPAHQRLEQLEFRPTNVLIVEDNKLDSRLMRHALEQIHSWPLAIDVADDGEKAIQFLLRESSFAESLVPDIVILDLNLPKYNGDEVLRIIRASEQLKHIPVCILSSSPAEITEKRIRNAGLKADGYFEKPSQVATFRSIASEIHELYQQVQRQQRFSANA